MRKLILAVAASWMLSASGAPGNAVVQYRMTFGGLPVGDVTDTVEFTDAAFAISSDAQATGLAKVLNLPAVQRKSTGRRLTDGSLLTEFFEQQRGDKLRSAEVDIEGGIIKWLNDGQPGEAQITHENVMDFLAFQYLFYSTGTTPQSGEVQMTDGRRSQIYAYEQRSDLEQLQVPYGTFDTVRYERTDNPQRKRVVWFAPELMLLPVKVFIDNDGSIIEFVMVDVSFPEQ